MRMRKVRISCKGSSPILMDRMSSETLDSLATGVRGTVQKDRSHRDVAAEKIYRNSDGKVGIDIAMLFSALVGAGRQVQYKGKTNISTATTSLLPGLIQFEEDFLLFPVPEGKQEPDWEPDVRLGRLPKDGTAVCLRRAKFADWGFDVHVVYDEDSIATSKVRELFEQAGRFQGLGSFRPNKRGPFGRFAVKMFDDVTPEDWRSADTRAPEAASTKSSGRRPKAAAEGGNGIAGRSQLNGQTEELAGVGVGNGAGGNGHASGENDDD